MIAKFLWHTACEENDWYNHPGNLRGRYINFQSIDDVEYIRNHPLATAKETQKRKAADESLRLLLACGNIHEDMHKPVDNFVYAAWV